MENYVQYFWTDTPEIKFKITKDNRVLVNYNNKLYQVYVAGKGKDKLLYIKDGNKKIYIVPTKYGPVFAKRENGKTYLVVKQNGKIKYIDINKFKKIQQAQEKVAAFEMGRALGSLLGAGYSIYKQFRTLKDLQKINEKYAKILDEIDKKIQKYQSEMEYLENYSTIDNIVTSNIMSMVFKRNRDYQMMLTSLPSLYSKEFLEYLQNVKGINDLSFYIKTRKYLLPDSLASATLLVENAFKKFGAQEIIYIPIIGIIIYLLSKKMVNTS